LILAVPLIAFAEGPVIGVLLTSAGSQDPWLPALHQELQDLGYAEGRDIHVELRSAEGHVDRLPALVGELLRLKPAAIVVGTEPALRAARDATRSVPIVMIAHTYDPVESGLIDSIARPGGNVTGISARTPELTSKRIELLKETIPALRRLAVIWDSPTQNQVAELKQPASTLGIELQLIQLHQPYDFKEAFRSARTKKADAIIVLTSVASYGERTRIAAEALENHLPMTGYLHELTRAGGFISYGPELRDSFYRVGYFIDRLLKGAKPSDLPIEQSATFRLVVNLRTAKALGIKVPETILVRADEVLR
jgi:putative ABC transport system substrate-binding protein